MTLAAKIALLIDCAGQARRRAAEYRAQARAIPRSSNASLSDAARNISNARWYLRLARDRNIERISA